MDAWRHERLAQEGASQGLKHRPLLLSHRRDITADITEDLSAIQVRKAPETFWLTLTMRMSRSARLLSNGALKSNIKASPCDLQACKRCRRFFGDDCFRRPRFFSLGDGGRITFGSSSALERAGEEKWKRDCMTPPAPAACR